MQLGRLFEIVYLLLDRKSMTSRELAAHFEVSKRTILRDIDTLAAAQIPVYTTQGKGGGISILDGFVLNKTALTEEEQRQILFALRSLSAAGHADTDGVLGKLGALFHKTDADWIEVDFSRWGQGARDNQRFDLLKRAIFGKKAVAFEYVSAYGEKSRRKSYPLKLVYKSKAWYLQGFCLEKQDYRTFKLNRILDVQLTDDGFEDKSFSPPPIESSNPPANSLISLELEFPPQVAYRVYDEFDEGCIEAGDDGWLRVCVRLPEDNWLYGFLLSFGKDVRILKPAHVRENIIQQHAVT